MQKYQKFDIKDKIKQSSWKCEVDTECLKSLLCVHNCAERNNISWWLQHFDLKRAQKNDIFIFNCNKRVHQLCIQSFDQTNIRYLSNQVIFSHSRTFISFSWSHPLIVLFQNFTSHIKFFKTNIIPSGNPQKMARML